MQLFYPLTLLMVISMAIFVIQNSNAPPPMIKFLKWRFETSLIYTILGSIIVWILMTFFYWIPRAIKSSIQSKELKRDIKNVETMLYKPAPLGQEGNKAKSS